MWPQLAVKVQKGSLREVLGKVQIRLPGCLGKGWETVLSSVHTLNMHMGLQWQSLSICYMLNDEHKSYNMSFTKGWSLPSPGS